MQTTSTRRARKKIVKVQKIRCAECQGTGECPDCGSEEPAVYRCATCNYGVGCPACGGMGEVEPKKSADVDD